MAKLIYIVSTSLDGYMEDEAGAIDWVDPDQVHEFITDLMRPDWNHASRAATLRDDGLLGCAGGELSARTPRLRTGLAEAREDRLFTNPAGAYAGTTRVERDFDVEAIRKLKRESEDDISIGGAELAGLAFEAGLVDECHLFLNPVLVGGGKPAFPAALRRNLELLATRRFSTGVIHVHYRVLTS